MKHRNSGYQAPTTGFLSLLPASWVPYAELSRVAKPTGTINIFNPFLFGALYAAWTVDAPLSTLLSRCGVLLVAAFWIRSAGCAWNDIIDRKVDRCVERCKTRPMARGALGVPEALVFTITEVALFLITLSVVLPQHWFYTVPSLALATLYPFAKRFTDHAQVILGITLAWSTLIGSSAMGVDPFALAQEETSTQFKIGIAALAACYCIWAVIHDTVYACQDYSDDVKAGVLSMAVTYQGYIRPLLAVLGTFQILLLVCAGAALESSFVYHAITAAGTAVLTAAMVAKVDLTNPKSCNKWFQGSCAGFSLLVSTGLFAEYMMRHSMQAF